MNFCYLRAECELTIIEKYGIKGQQVFDILGYKVKWSGLDPDNAEIVKLS
ncbi:MAG: uncharacterized protein PWP14_1819 [Methanolobus sp.]|jgi:hypothetical protein|nr:uncharacterized protein [Methanolobus sp.]